MNIVRYLARCTSKSFRRKVASSAATATENAETVSAGHSVRMFLLMTARALARARRGESFVDS